MFGLGTPTRTKPQRSSQAIVGFPFDYLITTMEIWNTMMKLFTVIFVSAEVPSFASDAVRLGGWRERMWEEMCRS